MNEYKRYYNSPELEGSLTLSVSISVATLQNVENAVSLSELQSISYVSV
jgi:hypothetical protein